MPTDTACQPLELPIIPSFERNRFESAKRRECNKEQRIRFKLKFTCLQGAKNFFAKLKRLEKRYRTGKRVISHDDKECL